MAADAAAARALEALEALPETVIEEISPHDHMFKGTGGRRTPEERMQRYLRSGRTGLEVIRLALVAAGKDEVSSVLDFACGHGRVLRWIKADLPGARLAACDIDHDGVDFCAKAFGATPVYGHEDPARVEVPEAYDLIWAGSLFTHLPPERWSGYLGLFERALAPGGLLVFTTHGREISLRIRDPQKARVYAMRTPEDRAAILEPYERDGLGYRDYELPESDRATLSLPHSYGISLTKPGAVLAMLGEHPRLALVTYMEGRFNGQDVVACRLG